MSSQQENKPFLQQFIDFLKTFGVIGLAIAYVIGKAASDLVNALVNDVVSPFIGLFVPAGNLDNISFKITNFWGHVSEFKLGHLILGVIDFLIIAWLVFLAYSQLKNLHLIEKQP